MPYTAEDRLKERTESAAKQRDHAESFGITVRKQRGTKLDTSYPDIYWTYEGIDEQGHLTGRVWADGPITVNRTEHLLNAHYRLTDRTWTWVKNQRQEHPGSAAHFSSWPGLERVDGGTVTEKSRLAIEQWAGSAIAHPLARPDWRSAIEAEARANEREAAARACDSAARYEYERAARILKTVGRYEERAAAIRAGADFDPKQPDKGIHKERH